ncbi:MAG: Ni/Fe-hydrogenase, b-type cytochrome subunit [Bacteroidetes bacterium]|nr:Ni/Fe-hydrogenase, b-type cytochrome subunit [Bacteroidota bacterium]
METRNFKRVLVWQLPVRIFHWINVLTVTLLILTGFLIANPPALMSRVEPTFVQNFGIVRFIHFASAYVFFFNMLLRIYWSFVGNKYAHWRAFWPFRKEFWQNVWHVLMVDILLQNKKIHHLKDISIGHNSVAVLSYVVMFFMALIMVFTGFSLYADLTTWWLPKLFAWVSPMLGGEFMTRAIHHITMWIFIFFALIHVYLVFYHDWLEGRGEVSSMFGGYKFVAKERFKKKVPKAKTDKEPEM